MARAYASTDKKKKTRVYMEKSCRISIDISAQLTCRYIFSCLCLSWYVSAWTLTVQSCYLRNLQDGIIYVSIIDFQQYLRLNLNEYFLGTSETWLLHTLYLSKFMGPLKHPCCGRPLVADIKNSRDKPQKVINNLINGIIMSGSFPDRPHFIVGCVFHNPNTNWLFFAERT